MTTVRAKDLTQEELRDLLSSLRPPEGELVRVWLEGHDGWSLAMWLGLSGLVSYFGSGRLPAEVSITSLLPCVTGRVFAPSGELRWRVLPTLGSACCRTVYLGQDSWAPPNLVEKVRLNDVPSRRVQTPLWGELSPQTRGRDGASDVWIELKIPQRFQYPVAAVPASKYTGVKADVSIWEDDRGEVQFVQLCDLHAYDVEKERV